MSIIQEALKKTEDSMSMAPAENRTGPHDGKGTATAKTTLSRAYILGPLALVALLGAGLFLVGTGAKQKAAGPAAAKKDAAGPATPASRQETVKKSAKETPKFALNGIMYMDSGSKAIVNGAVVKEGDLINGASVRKITRQNVLLDCGDAEIQLNLND